jgi:hypothetical protein
MRPCRAALPSSASVPATSARDSILDFFAYSPDTIGDAGVFSPRSRISCSASREGRRTSKSKNQLRWIPVQTQRTNPHTAVHPPDMNVVICLDCPGSWPGESPTSGPFPEP